MLKKDIKLILHDKKTLLTILVLILVTFAAVFLSKPYGEAKRVVIGVADEEKSDYSRLMLTFFTDNEVFNSYIEIVSDSEEKLKKLFDSGKIDVYLVIPKDFTTNLIRIQNTPIKAVINASDRTKAVLYKNMFDSYAEYISSVEVNCQSLYDIMSDEGYSPEDIEDINNKISLDLIFTALGKDNFFIHSDSERIAGVSLENYYIYDVIAIILLYCGMFAGIGLLKEKLSKVSERLRSIGVSGFSQVLCKLLAYMSVYVPLIIIMTLMVNVSSKIPGFATEMNFEFTDVLRMILFLAVAIVFFLITALCAKSMSTYIIFSNMLILLMIICGGGVIPVMYLPDTISKIAGVTPLYRFICSML